MHHLTNGAAGWSSLRRQREWLVYLHIGRHERKTHGYKPIDGYPLKAIGQTGENPPNQEAWKMKLGPDNHLPDFYIDRSGDTFRMRESLSEKEAISMAIGGDYGAQRYLYDQYRAKWYMICLRYLPNRADAQDALQNGLIHIFSKLEKFNPELGEFGGWTARILTNECIQIIRRNQKNIITQELTNDLPVYYPEESGLDKVSAEDIMRIIQKLPTGYRMIFNMYVFEGYSHREIAEHLKISEGTSKSQLFKARKMLQEALEVII